MPVAQIQGTTTKSKDEEEIHPDHVNVLPLSVQIYILKSIALKFDTKFDIFP